MAKPPAVNSVLDVAAYIIGELGSVTAMKLQKLVYYCQAWSLVWDERPMFPEAVQAWANGPVVPELYQAYRGLFHVESLAGGDPGNLDRDAIDTIEAVLRHYGKKSSQWLSDLTHEEPPWREARKGLPAGTRGTREIGHAAMAEYYGGLK